MSVAKLQLIDFLLFENQQMQTKERFPLSSQSQESTIGKLEPWNDRACSWVTDFVKMVWFYICVLCSCDLCRSVTQMQTMSLGAVSQSSACSSWAISLSSSEGESMWQGFLQTLLLGYFQNWRGVLWSDCSSLTIEGSLLAPLMNSSRESLPAIWKETKG